MPRCSTARESPLQHDQRNWDQRRIVWPRKSPKTGVIHAFVLLRDDPLCGFGIEVGRMVRDLWFNVSKTQAGVVLGV